MHAIAPQSPVVHLQLVEFAIKMQTPSSDVPETVLALIRQEFETILPISSVNLDAYNTQYLQQRPGDSEAVLAVAKAQWAISGRKDKEGVSNRILEGLKECDRLKLPVSEARKRTKTAQTDI